MQEQRQSPEPERRIPRNSRLELAWTLARLGDRGEATKLAHAFADKSMMPEWAARDWVKRAVARKDWKMAEAELSRLTSGDSIPQRPPFSGDWKWLAALHHHRGNTDGFKAVRSQMGEIVTGSESLMVNS